MHQQANGHQEGATVDNMMGGNNTIRRKRGERNTYRQLNPQQPRNPRNEAGAANAANGNEDANTDANDGERI